MFFQRSWNDNIISPTESKLLAMFLPYFLTLSDDVKPNLPLSSKMFLTINGRGQYPIMTKIVLMY